MRRPAARPGLEADPFACVGLAQVAQHGRQLGLPACVGVKEPADPFEGEVVAAEPLPREQRRDESRMRGERVANASHRGSAAPEDRPVAAELSEDERERIERPALVEAEQVRRRRRRAEAGDERGRVPPTLGKRRPERAREPAGEVATDRHRAEEVAAAHPSLGLRQRKQDGDDLGVRMTQRAVVGVLEVERVGERAVHERRARPPTCARRSRASCRRAPPARFVQATRTGGIRVQGRWLRPTRRSRREATGSRPRAQPPESPPAASPPRGARSWPRRPSGGDYKLT